MLSSDGSGRFALRDKRHYCLMLFCYIANFLRLVSFQIKDSRRRVLNFEI